MASKKIEDLDQVIDLSASDLMVVGQGSLGRKATIQEIFDLTPGEGPLEVPTNIPFITYDRQVTLTSDQKAIARSNLGISETGEPTDGTVTSVNTLTGDVTLYLSNLLYSESDKVSFSDKVSSYIVTHNSSEDAHSTAIGNSITSHNGNDEAHSATIESHISTHNSNSDAHKDTIDGRIDTKLSGDGTTTNPGYDNRLNSPKVTITSTLPTPGLEGWLYAVRSENDPYVPYIYENTSQTEGEYHRLVPTNLSQFTDDISTVRFSSQSLETSQKTQARDNIGAIGKITGLNSSLTGDNVTINCEFIGAVPTTRTINNIPLSSNITLDSASVGAVPTTRKINNKALSQDITLNASDVSALPISGGTLTGNLTVGQNNKFIISNIMYGAGDPPTSAVAGQIYFKYSA